jgi:hypothetical protein
VDGKKKSVTLGARHALIRDVRRGRFSRQATVLVPAPILNSADSLPMSEDKGLGK